MTTSARTRDNHPFNRVALLSVLMVAGACVHQPVRTPSAAAPAIVIHMKPSQQWTDSGVLVQAADWLFIDATGEVFWSARAKAVGPDGVNGYSGWPVGVEVSLDVLRERHSTSVLARGRFIHATFETKRRNHHRPFTCRQTVTSSWASKTSSRE